MMKWLLFSLLLACSFPSIAQACDTAETATPESTCVVLKREGILGVWFDLATADVYRKLKLEVPELRIQITTLETKAATRESQLGEYHEIVRLKDDSLKVAANSMDVFARRARKAEEALDAWYRSPALWFALGAVTTAGVAVMAADEPTTGLVLIGSGLGTSGILLFFI